MSEKKIPRAEKARSNHGPSRRVPPQAIGSAARVAKLDCFAKGVWFRLIMLAAKDGRTPRKSSELVRLAYLKSRVTPRRMSLAIGRLRCAGLVRLSRTHITLRGLKQNAASEPRASGANAETPVARVVL